MPMTSDQKREKAKTLAAQQLADSMRIANGESLTVYKPIILDPKMHAWFAEWKAFGAAIKRWYLSSSQNGKRIDAFVLFAVPRAVGLLTMQLVEWLYVNGTSFVWAHAFLFVGADELYDRSKACSNCDQRYIASNHCYCRAIQNACSSCPTKTWWPMSRLSWRKLLRNQTCPKGLWNVRGIRGVIARKLGRSKAV